MKNKKRFNQGFTLIEIMVVLVIIGIMAALIVPNLMSRVDSAKLTAAQSDIKNLSNALQMYKLDNGRLPTNQQGLKALESKPTVEPLPKNYPASGYLSSQLPKDPWGSDYQYQNPGKHGEFDIYSFGPKQDAASGEDGEGVIGGWQ